MQWNDVAKRTAFGQIKFDVIFLLCFNFQINISIKMISVWESVRKTERKKSDALNYTSNGRLVIDNHKMK